MNALLDAIIGGAIKSRQVVVLAALALLLAGIWFSRDARLDALPDFTPPIVVVQAEAPGLGSSAVEQLVTTPLEQALLGIPDVARMRSTSSPGLSVAALTFDDDVDLFRARQLVGDRIADARARLPPALPAPRIAPITAPVGSLFKLSYTAPPGDPAALRALWQFAEWKLRPRLSAIEGVARVTVLGGAAARVEVRPDPAALLAHGVALRELRDALAGARDVAQLGYVLAGAQQRALRADGAWSWSRLEQIGDAVVASHDGLPVRVRDVAEVVPAQAPPVGSALYDGQPAISVQVEKLPWADTPRLSEQVERALSALDAERPPGTTRRPATFRQADFVLRSLGALGNAMGIGAALVAAILIAFLRSPRLAAISLSAIPLSVVAAATVLIARGVTLNGMILGGLAIAVGEVVDDAIVDVENVWRRLQLNGAAASPRPPLAVVREASVEVRGAVVYASLIVVAVLAPVILLGGLAGRIFSPLALSYALAVAASLLVALTVTPALCALLLPHIAAAQPRPTLLAIAIERGYQRVLAWFARRPGPVVIAASLLGLGSLAILPLLGGSFLPEFREGMLIAEITAWPGTSLEETTRLATRLDALLRSGPDVRHVATRVGRASLDEDAAPVHRIELDIVLADDSGDPEDAAARILALGNQLPGLQIGVEGFLGERINELLSGERTPLAIKLFGSELAELRARAAALIPELARIDGIEAVHSGDLVDVPTSDVQLDDAALALAGIRKVDALAGTAALREGLEVADVGVPGGFSVPLVIAGPESLQGGERIADLPIFAASSAVLPLSSLARIVDGSEPSAIDHENGRRMVTITASAPGGQLSAIATRVEQLLARRHWPPGASFELAGQAAERSSASTRLLLIAAAVLVAIFAFLWVAFDSALDAAVILGGLPLGIAGGVAVALLLPDGVSMAGLVGFVTLCGIISRNGIMLVAHKNQLFAQTAVDASAREALILRASHERLLPILMTAATAFFGLLPLAASLHSAGSELEAPMAIIVCGGLISSTLLNLIAVPCFYLWYERRRPVQP